MTKRDRRERRDRVKAHLERRMEGTKRPWAEWVSEEGGWRIREDIRRRLFWIAMLIMWVGAGIALISYILF